MYKTGYILAVVVISLSLFSIAAAPQPPYQPTITLLDPLPTVLAEGETYSVRILVESEVAFSRVMVMNAPTYPACLASRGVESAAGGTRALITFTLIGRKSTADRPDGVVPSILSVGVRYGGEGVVVQQFPFAVAIR